MSSQSFLETLETLVAGSPTGCVIAMPRADGSKEGSTLVETSVSPFAVGIIVLLFVLPSLYMGKEVFHSPSIDPYTKAAVLGFDAFGLVVLGLHCTRCSPWTGVLKFLLIEAVASFLGYGDEIGAALQYNRAIAAAPAAVSPPPRQAPPPPRQPVFEDEDADEPETNPVAVQGAIQ